MGHTVRNGSHLEQGVTFVKKGHTVTICRKVKNGSFWKNGTRYKKWVSFGKMGHTPKLVKLKRVDGLHSEKWKRKSEKHLEKRVTL